MKRPIRKQNLIFFCLFTSVFLVFMGKMFFLREAFITGDNLVQGLPWLKVYSAAIKNMRFPFWVTGIHCGFPLIGEGQVGGFYPLNLMFFFLLPFKLAYNYSVMFHIFIAGTAIYFVARKLGADIYGGFVSAIILCFGSAFSNIGYHLGMVRSLSFFPLGILMIEYYFNREDRKFLFLLAVVMTFQILSGSLQTAIYSFVLYFVYLVSGIFVHELKLRRGVIRFLSVSLIPVIFFLPQFFLTLKVVKFSGRISSLDFALWGSLNPVSILTIYFPSIFRFKGQITTEDLFIGSLSVLFVVSVLKSIKWEKNIQPAVFIGGIAVFFALGWFNPIYIMAVKLLKFYTFRAPSRFVFFFVFSVSLLAGVGFTHFFGQRFSVRSKDTRTFLFSIYISFLTLAMARFILVSGKDFILRMGQYFVQRFIEGSPYHRYDIGDYHTKINNIYNSMVDSIMIHGQYLLISLLFLAVSAGFSYFLISRKISLRKNNNRSIFKILAICIILINLWCYRFFPGGYAENVNNFSSLVPAAPRIFKILKNGSKDYRILPFDIKEGSLPVWALPNANMFFGLDSVAVYSPLAAKKYYSLLKDFQVVDDSIGLRKPVMHFNDEDYDLFRMLNIKYVVSRRDIDAEHLQEKAKEDGICLYEFDSPFKKGFYASDIKGTFISDQNINIVREEDGHIEFILNNDAPGFFVFSQQFFPGWEASVNGGKKKIFIFKDILMAVKVEAGDNRIVFTYHPF